MYINTLFSKYTPQFKLYLNFVACPDIVCRTVTLDYEFIVMACDGIWDVLSNEEVIDFVRSRLAQQMDPESVSVIVGVV